MTTNFWATYLYHMIGQRPACVAKRITIRSLQLFTKVFTTTPYATIRIIFHGFSITY